MTIENLKREIVEWNGAYQFQQAMIISSIWVMKLVELCSLAFLAPVRDVDTEDPSNRCIHIFLY